jgi:hypothetical protein
VIAQASRRVACPEIIARGCRRYSLQQGGPDCGEAYQSQLIEHFHFHLVTLTPAARELFPFFILLVSKLNTAIRYITLLFFLALPSSRFYHPHFPSPPRLSTLYLGIYD